MTLSTALMLRYSFRMETEANAIEQAVKQSLNQGLHTADLQIEGGKQAGTREMTDTVVKHLSSKSVSDNVNRMFV